LSGCPEIDEEIKKLATLSVWSATKLLDSGPDAVFLAGLRAETQAMIVEDEESNSAFRNYQEFRENVIKITRSITHECSGYGTPLPTLNDYSTKAQNSEIWQIRAAIETEQAEMDSIKEALEMLTNSISEETKTNVLDHGDSVRFKRGNVSWGKRVYGEAEWDKHQKETEEQIQILKVGVTFHEKLIRVLEGVINERESRKKEILARLESARKISKEAEKLIPKIARAQQHCEESNLADTKAVREFVQSWQKFDKLKTEFATLNGSGVEFGDFPNAPVFPSSSGLIATQTDAARKAKIFGIFEKSEEEK
jgi:predicted translin family RNA/ssDNA-binding protein